MVSTYYQPMNVIFQAVRENVGFVQAFMSGSPQNVCKNNRRLLDSISEDLTSDPAHNAFGAKGNPTAGLAALKLGNGFSGRMAVASIFRYDDQVRKAPYVVASDELPESLENFSIEASSFPNPFGTLLVLHHAPNTRAFNINVYIETPSSGKFKRPERRFSHAATFGYSSKFGECLSLPARPTLFEAMCHAKLRAVGGALMLNRWDAEAAAAALNVPTDFMPAVMGQLGITRPDLPNMDLTTQSKSGKCSTLTLTKSLDTVRRAIRENGGNTEGAAEMLGIQPELLGKVMRLPSFGSVKPFFVYGSTSLGGAIEERQRLVIEESLKRNEFDPESSARELGIDEATFIDEILRLEIDFEALSLASRPTAPSRPRKKS